MTLHQRIAAARRQLEEAGLVDTASIDAEVLARHLLGWDRAQLLARHRDSPPPGFDAPYQNLIERRARREPVALITGTREFWGRDFEVTRDTLVPRPETELIVEEALQLLQPNAPSTVIDVGTGSGCLAVTLAAERSDARVVATDVSPAALVVAAANARRHHVADRVRFVRTDLVDGLDSPVDLIVSNPPYIPERDAATLPADVVDYEPATALFGGAEGMSVIDRLLATLPPLLAPGGAFIVEFGCGQESAVRASAEREGWRVRRVRHDLQGIARTAVLERTRE